MKDYIFKNRELSWLDFNARVLQEAEDKKVPIIERLRFIGIFSNNLDEFFKVRYATVKRIALSGKKQKKLYKGPNATDLLQMITNKAIELQEKSDQVLESIIDDLKDDDFYEECSSMCRENYKKSMYNEKRCRSYLEMIFEGLIDE